METGVTVRRSIIRIPLSLYIPRISHCRYIFCIYFRVARLRGLVSIVFIDSLVSSEPLRKRVRAKRTSQKKRTFPFPPASLFFAKLSGFFLRFASSGTTISCFWHGRTFNFNHRLGNYKSCSRSRTLSIKDFRFSRDDRLGGREKEMEIERKRKRKRLGREIGNEWSRRILPSVCHLLSVSSFTYSLGKANRSWTTCARIFSINVMDLGSSRTVCEINFVLSSHILYFQYICTCVIIIIVIIHVLIIINTLV